MSWSFPIGHLFGSQIRVHLTFFLLLLWIGIAAYTQGGGAAALESVVFILAIFACVVAHEFGHALMARRYGIATPDITLLPIGGVARLEGMPEEPRHEIAVALAGPAVNFVIAAVIFVVFGFGVDAEQMAAIEDPQISFAARLGMVNLFIAVFNLIPAFPMDGGRVLRALLATRYSRARATSIAAKAGQAVAFAFGFLGLISGNVLLVFIAIFVYLAASSESAHVALVELARGLSVRDAMITRFETLGPGATLGDAADALIRTTQHEFPVVDNDGRLAGFLTREVLIGALANGDRKTPVASAMRRDIPVVGTRAGLDKALTAMQKANAPAIGVTDENGRLEAYITPENLGELMMVRRAP